MPCCEYCGDEVGNDDWDYDQYDRKHYLCSRGSCHREFHRDCQYEEDERRWRAAEDGYSRY